MARGRSADPDRGWRPGPEDREQPAGRVLPLLLGGYLAEMRGHEHGARVGDDEELHQFRVSMRRGRSLMAVGSRVFPEEELHLLGALATWMMDVTSPVRDLDVLLAEMPTLGDRVVPELGDGVASLTAALLDRRGAARRDLVAALDGERYQVLLRRWDVMSTVYRIGGGEPGPDARRRTGPVVDRMLLASFERLRRRGTAALGTDERTSWHDLRKALKRFRYLVSTFAPMYPDGSFDKVLKRLASLQDALGELQDRHVHAAIVEEVGVAAGGRSALAAGVVADSLHRDSEEAHRRCRDLWSDFDRPKLRHRMRDLLA